MTCLVCRTSNPESAPFCAGCTHPVDELGEPPRGPWLVLATSGGKSGRYDRLLELVGGEPLPAVGFGMGDVVLGELLQERGLRPAYERTLDHFIIAVGSEQRPVALKLAHALRSRGLSVIYALKEQSVRKQFSAAATDGAREVIVLGPEEVGRGLAVVVVSHDIPKMLSLADRIAVMRQGRTVSNTPARDLTLTDVVTLMLGGGVMGQAA